MHSPSCSWSSDFLSLLFYLIPITLHGCVLVHTLNGCLLITYLLFCGSSRRGTELGSKLKHWDKPRCGRFIKSSTESACAGGLIPNPIGVRYSLSPFLFLSWSRRLSTCMSPFPFLLRVAPTMQLLSLIGLRPPPWATMRATCAHMKERTRPGRVRCFMGAYCGGHGQGSPVGPQMLINQ